MCGTPCLWDAAFFVETLFARRCPVSGTPYLWDAALFAGFRPISGTPSVRDALITGCCAVYETLP